MDKRLELHEKLCKLLKSRYAYFQPPPNIQMHYPAIRYKLSGVDKLSADNRAYRLVNRYEVVYIDEDPESDMYLQILEAFPMCSLDRTYFAGNLNHWVLTLYY